jgi:DNA-binding MarR family transcriptional regulator
MTAWTGVSPAAVSPGEVAARLRAPLLRITRLIRLQRVDTTVSLAQLSALNTLEQRGPLSAGELAGFECVQPPSMTKVIAALEEAGLARRGPHPGDKRQAIIAITESGSARLESERLSREAWLSVQLRKLDEGERELLLKVAPLLDKIAGL